MADVVGSIILIVVGLILIVLARWVGSQVSGQPGGLLRTLMILLGVILVIVGIILLVVALVQDAAGPPGPHGNGLIIHSGLGILRSARLTG
jgi:predicted transporter